MAEEEPKKLPEINKGDSKINIKGDMTLSDLMGDSGKGDFGKLNMLLSLKYIKVRSNVLKTIIKETQGGNLKGLDIDKSISLSDLLGEIPKAGFFTALKFQNVKKRILKKADKATKDAKLELGTKIELNDLLGSTPDQDFFTKFKYFSIRQSILKKIKKAVKDFNPKFDSEAISNTLTSTNKVETDVKGTESVEKNVVNNVENNESETRSLSFSLEDLNAAFDNFKLSLQDIVLNVNNSSDESSGKPIEVEVASMPEKDTDLGQVEEQKEQRKVLVRIADALEKGGGRGEKAGDVKASGGLGALGKLGKGLGEGIGQLFKGIGKGLRFLGKNFGNIMKGIVTLGALGISLIPAAKAFQEFSEVSWQGVGMGLTALGGLAVVAALIGKASGQMLIGAAAIGVLGLALLPAAKAFQMFGEVSWGAVGMGFAVLAGLGVVAALLSAATVPMLIGAAAIAVLGAALLPAAKAFEMFGNAVEPIGDFINNVLGGLASAFEKSAAAVGDLIRTISIEIEQLAALDGGELLLTAAGISAVGAALATFGAGGAVGSILSSIGEGFASLFGAKSPIEQLKEIATIGPDLERSAKAIEALPKSLSKISDALKEGFKGEIKDAGKAIKGLLKDIDKGLDKLDFKKLDKVTGLIIHRVVTDTAEVSDVNSQQAAANAAPTIINNNVDNSQSNQSVSYSSSGVMDEGTVPAYGSYASMGSADY